MIKAVDLGLARIGIRFSPQKEHLYKIMFIQSLVDG